MTTPRTHASAIVWASLVDAGAAPASPDASAMQQAVRLAETLETQVRARVEDPAAQSAALDAACVALGAIIKEKYRTCDPCRIDENDAGIAVDVACGLLDADRALGFHFVSQEAPGSIAQPDSLGLPTSLRPRRTW